MNPRLVTTLGDFAADQVGWMLAHEHICANFRADDDCKVSVSAVVRRMTPELIRAHDTGITAIVDTTAVGAARRPDVLLAVSQAAKMPILAATGVFKEPAKSISVQRLGESGLCDWMSRELIDGIGDTPIRAGWIKLSVTDSGIQPHEATLIRAAARASVATGAVVGSHTVGAALANAELDIFEAAGGSPDRFIWIHTQLEPDIDRHAAFACRGAWIEYDAIDEDRSDDEYIDLILRALDGGYADHVLLSHDRVGYDPNHQNGGTFKSYCYLTKTFLPKLKAHGVDDSTVDMLLRQNPFRAYAR